MNCSICLETINETSKIILPCEHLFHKDCVVNLIRPFCPLCKIDISEFIQSEFGVSQNEIENKTNEDDFRIYCEHLGTLHNNELSDEDLFKIILNAKNNSTDWHFIYRDIIIDRISNAEHLFSKISCQKHQKEPGIFISMNNVNEFIANVIAEVDDSNIGWIPLYDLIESPNKEFFNIAKSLTERIENKETDYGVLILLEDDDGKMFTCPKLMSTDENKKKMMKQRAYGGGYTSGLTTIRPSRNDILNSMKRCVTCRCSGHVESSSKNPEYRWAKNYLKRMNKKNNK